MEQNSSAGFKAGFIACLPTVAGYWSIGFAAGSVGSLSGYSITEILLLASLLYAGSAQFLFYGMAAAGAAPLAIGVAVFLVNVRYLLMGSAVSPFFEGQTAAQKFLGGALLTDETFAVAVRHANRHGTLPFRWLLGLNGTAYGNWIVANLIGAVLAGSIPPGIADGLSFSLTAMFIGLLLLAHSSSPHRWIEGVSILFAFTGCWVLSGIVAPTIAVLIATVGAATAAAGVAALRRTRGVSCRAP